MAFCWNRESLSEIHLEQNTLSQSTVGSWYSITKQWKRTDKMTVVSIFSRRKKSKGMFPSRFLHQRKQGADSQAVSTATNGITMFPLNSTELLELYNKVQPVLVVVFIIEAGLHGGKNKRQENPTWALEPHCLKCFLASVLIQLCGSRQVTSSPHTSGFTSGR